ncbi:hypothetical protein JRC04_00920 [Mycolicibacterium sp. S2-37]|uniref:hypothetical protein n=1 Tax=Mycolicibacterium sp. S2-37 TaxID=2810297 RepID=UPI001A947296|nr:hypothetical protein [Mycolicibacterium sp. S2-37]MBO0676017.1 hypothetical protein [Mycolicibacterium sp. S2-37]
MRAKILTTLAVTTALMTVGCTTPTVVNNDEPRPSAAAGPTSTAAPALNSTNLVNAFYYGAPVDGVTQYFFTTPSGRWQCAIVPRIQAGCQAADGADLDVPGAPETVLDAAGQETTPNAIVLNRDGDAAFAALEGAPFDPEPGPANVLQFNQVLAAAGFRCNVQEASGISCLSERSGKGFAFSTEAFVPQYLEVPAGAPIAPPTSTAGG